MGLTLVNTGFAARLLQQIPKYTLDAAIVKEVNRDCQPIGPDDFESFSTAFTVGAELEINTGVHFGFEGFVLPDVLAELGFPVAYDALFFKQDFPVPPSNSTGSPQCIIISDDSPTNANASSSASSLSGVPGPTGTMVLAESAVPTWDFAKIESYSSANGHLPTNVDYSLMVKATAVPPQLQPAIQALTAGNSSDGTPSGAPGSSPSGGPGGGAGGGTSSGAIGTTGSPRHGTCIGMLFALVAWAI